MAPGTNRRLAGSEELPEPKSRTTDVVVLVTGTNLKSPELRPRGPARYRLYVLLTDHTFSESVRP